MWLEETGLEKTEFGFEFLPTWMSIALHLEF